EMSEMIGALVVLLEGGLDRVVLIDSRPFVDYNTSHILEALNVNGSKLMKRRLQQDKVQITELLQHCARSQVALQGDQEVVVYDQNSSDPAALGADSFLSVLLVKLERSFPSVHLLSGGFCEFSQLFPGLCEGKSVLVPSCPSQPGPAVSNLGPTRILPHLYLGCQRDVLNKELMQQNDITFVLNASNTCPKPDFVPESHFLRVPVNDSFCEKILPWLDRSLDFIEKAKASDGRVLVHCLAGISRSATIAIAYIMKRMDMSLDEAYRSEPEPPPAQCYHGHRPLTPLSLRQVREREAADHLAELQLPGSAAGLREEHQESGRFREPTRPARRRASGQPAGGGASVGAPTPALRPGRAAGRGSGRRPAGGRV
uniref:Dual specificity phosphatase 16 n=1 Tax=Xiphophorus maculatus TaxID=8083 RepID=M3ZKI7_XIPMA